MPRYEGLGLSDLFPFIYNAVSCPKKMFPIHHNPQNIIPPHPNATKQNGIGFVWGCSGFLLCWGCWLGCVLLWVDGISVGDNVSPNLSVRGRHVPRPLYPCLSGSGVSGSTISPVSDAVYRTPIPPEPQSRAGSSLRLPLSCPGWSGYSFSGRLILLYLDVNPSHSCGEPSPSIARSRTR